MRPATLRHPHPLPERRFRVALAALLLPAFLSCGSPPVDGDSVPGTDDRVLDAASPADAASFHDLSDRDGDGNAVADGPFEDVPADPGPARDATTQDTPSTDAAAGPPVLLAVDTNRDGKASFQDEDLPGKSKWTSQAGAVLLVNSDDDDSDHQPDCEDDQVNGPDDLPDMAPIQAALSTLPPKGWTLSLSVLPPSSACVRLFLDAPDGWLPSSPSGVLSIPPMLAVPAARIAAEALAFPGQDGCPAVIDLVLELSEPDGTVVASDAAQMRIGPLILTSALNSPQRVLTVHETPAQDSLVEQLESLVTPLGLPLTAVGELGVPLALPLGQDLFVQDALEIGFSSLPAGKNPHVVAYALPASRRKPLDALARELLLGPDFGIVVLPPAGGTPAPAQGFNNLEVSPVLLANQMYLPFGRVYTGFDPGDPSVAMPSAVLDLVDAQDAQGPVLALDTGWLASGAVDDMLSFIPWNGGPGCCGKGFVLLLPCTKDAIGILEAVEAAGGEAALLLPGTQGEISVGEVLSDMELRAFNDGIDVRLEGVISVLSVELGLEPEDIVRVPALYRPRAQDGRAVPVFPSPLNSVVLGKLLLVSDPHGPVVDAADPFELDLEERLAPYGQVVQFVDDLAACFDAGGGMHRCTAVHRLPFNTEWWYQ